MYRLNYCLIKLYLYILRSGEACNHIGALMYALADLTEKRKNGTLAVTSKKCAWDQFNNPRKRKLTPKRSSELKFKKYTFQSCSDPVKRNCKKELFAGCSVNEIRFKENLTKVNPGAGWLLNFVENRPEDKVPQFLSIDFSFCDSVDLESDFVLNEMEKVMSSLVWSHRESEKLEKLTRGQGKNVVWEEERKLRLTSSNFGEVLCLKKDTPSEGLIKRMLYLSFQNRFVRWGLKHEAAARRKYEIVMKRKYPDLTVSTCGLIVKENIPYLGASPDGLVKYSFEGQTYTGVLEIKCPASDRWKSKHSTDCAKDSDFCSYIDSDTGLCRLKTNHKYYYQVQGQMAIANKQWCDFVIWTLGGVSVERIDFDEKCWTNMFPKLKYFYQHAFLPEIFSRRIQRGLKK